MKTITNKATSKLVAESPYESIRHGSYANCGDPLLEVLHTAAIATRSPKVLHALELAHLEAEKCQADRIYLAWLADPVAQREDREVVTSLKRLLNITV